MKIKLPYIIHILPIILLSVLTLIKLDSNLILPYTLFTGIFILSTIISVNNILKKKEGYFFYLLNIMFLLGHWFKYSLQKILNSNFREPIGNYQYSSSNDQEVLYVIVFGIIGFIFSNYFLKYFIKLNTIQKIINKIKSPNTTEFKDKYYFFIFALTTILAIINLKYNILLFALKPSINLPLKGNAIYFLLLTRATIFLSLFYTFNSYNKKNVLFGALIATIASVGVLSRMMTLFYFSIIFAKLISDYYELELKDFLKRAFYTTSFFLVFAFLTVYLGTSARNYYMANSKITESIKVNPESNISNAQSISKNIIPENKSILKQQFNLKDKFETFIDLALGRWVGIEGVLAVNAYPNKGLQLLKDGFFENSYQGFSFYTKIAQPNFQPNNTSNVISTSVPGPIAFFYYSGSRLIVLFGIFIFCSFLSLPEYITNHLFINNKLIPIFVSSFIVFDFFQFGIAPLAFFRYLTFSVLSVVVFYFFNLFVTNQVKSS